MSKDDFSEKISPWLDVIDEKLGLDGVPVSRRTIEAALMLVAEFVIEVGVGDQRVSSFSKVNEFVSEPWFKAVYSHVEHWYYRRYERRINNRSKQVMCGTVLVVSTAFEIEVPITKSKVETAGQTAWLSFPSGVQADEDVLAWMVDPPDWSTYDEIARVESIDTARQTASLIRRIASRLTCANLTDELTRSLLAGVRVHLHSASSLILREGDEGGFARAQWELQMACESAYKGLLQQQTGAFPRTHDLFTLHDQSDISEASVRRDWLVSLPRWSEAADLRYGIGDHPTMVGICYWYLLVMKIVAGVLDNLKGMDPTTFSVLLKKGPWLSDVPPALD